MKCFVVNDKTVKQSKVKVSKTERISYKYQLFLSNRNSNISIQRFMHFLNALQKLKILFIHTEAKYI